MSLVSLCHSPGTSLSTQGSFLEGHFLIISTIPIRKEGVAGNKGIITNLDKGLGHSYQEMAALAGVKT